MVAPPGRVSVTPGSHLAVLRADAHVLPALVQTDLVDLHGALPTHKRAKLHS